MDWSSTGVLSVGLGSSVYLWTATTSSVERLCDLTATTHSSGHETCSSVAWYEDVRQAAYNVLI